MSRGKADADGTVRTNRFHQTCRGIGDGMQATGTRGNTGSPSGGCRSDQLAARESQAGPYGVAERSVRPMKPGNAGGGKGLKGNAKSNEDGGIDVSLTTPVSVQKLQTALHDKAKESPDFRFHALYDKVYRKDVLAFAYERCKANGGAAGVDGQTFEDIEAYGVEQWLDELVQELKSRTYQPLPVRRVYIPKPDGKQRPLGVPAIRDRTAEMAAVLVLEPIFETDLQSEQYAYRQDRSALDAVKHVHKLINTGHEEIVDADLSSYFDTLPHSELLKWLAESSMGRCFI